jgi:hypothetical protein
MDDTDTPSKDGYDTQKSEATKESTKINCNRHISWNSTAAVSRLSRTRDINNIVAIKQ